MSSNNVKAQFGSRLLLKKIIITIFLATVLIGITGTSYRFDIVIEMAGMNKPIFRFSKPLLAPPRWTHDDVELNSFQVVRKKANTWDYRNPIWVLELRPGSSIRVDKIEYGVPPPNFTETVPAKPLEQNNSYLVLAFGLGSSGSKEFTLGE